MANSYLNMVTFIIISLCYFFVKKFTFTYEIASDPKKNEEYKSTGYKYLGVYFLAVVILQVIGNVVAITSTCGGNIGDNIGAAALSTFAPWTLIFGVMILILNIYPGFKSAFSDVIGYFIVSSSANKVLTDLLINKEINDILNKGENENMQNNDNAGNIEVPNGNVEAPDANVQADANLQVPADKNTMIGGAVSKQQIQDTADLIIKICGNTAVLINQIVPTNFDSYWKLLTPLKKEKYQDDSSKETQDIKKQLFEIVALRDNIGEILWYIYTGILLVSLVQLKISTRGCASNPKTMEENYKKFLETQEKAKEQKELATSTTYTITN
jgi:hypothetical protein